MKTFEVTIIQTAYATVFVDAENEEQASELAWGKYDGCADDCVANEIFNVEEIEEEATAYDYLCKINVNTKEATK